MSAGAGKNRRAEIGRWVRFFHDGAADFHPERWRSAGLAPETAGRLLACDRSRGTLSRHPESLAPGWDFGWNPWEPPAGDCADWALWPGGKIRRAGVFFAMGCLRGEIARLIRRDDVRGLKEAFGDDAYSFAMRRSVLVWPADWPEATADAGDLPLVEKTRLAAGRGIACWLESLPAGLASRVRLKLPPALDDVILKTPESWSKEARTTCLKRLAGLNRTVAGL